MRRLLVVLVTVAALAVPASVTATGTTTTYKDLLVGVEIPPVTSTQGTFTGLALGQLPGTWVAQIEHDELSSPSPKITGGTFTLLGSRGQTVAGVFVGGQIWPINPGTGCRNQTYGIAASMTTGSFTGVLTHYRIMLFGTCLTYSASISGTGTLTP